MAQEATLAGFALNALAPVSWTEVPGVKPHTQIFTLVQGQGESLFAAATGRLQIEGGGRDIQLIIKSDQRPVLTVEQLSILKPMPATEPYQRNLLVADLRWRWPYKRVILRANLRRRTGNKRSLKEELIEIDQFQPDVAYIPASLIGETVKWEAADIIKAILDQLVGSGNYIFKNEVTLRTRQLPIENFIIDDPGDIGLAKALTKIPGINVKVNLAGRVVVYDQLNSAEKSVLSATGPAVPGQGYTYNMKNRLVRPREIHIYFTREMEVRHDFAPPGQQVTLTSVTRARAINQRVMKNVLPIPDLELDINGTTFGNGSWVEFLDDGLLKAWGAGPGLEGFGALPPLTLEKIRQDYAFGLLNLTYGVLGEQIDPEFRWRQRINGVIQHFYQTFQLNRRWVDRSLSIKAWRVALLDPENGTFARAPAYLNFAVRPSVRGMLANPDKASYAYNVLGYADQIEDATRAPLILQVVDMQVGIIRLNFQAHPLGLTQEYFPSALTGIPTADISQVNNRGDKRDTIELAEDHKVAIILTHVPAFPNNLSQFHKVVRKRVDAERVLGRQIAPQDPIDLGPILEIRVPPGNQLTARYKWDDDRADAIESAFGINQDAEDAALTAKLRPLLVNEEEVEAIADAVAAAAYLPHIDRIAGTFTNDLNKNLVVDGLVKGVKHNLAPNGVATSTIEISPNVARLDFAALLPDDIRKIIMSLVQ